MTPHASRLTPHASRLSHAAGDEIIVEEFLDGEEASFFALVNGEESVSMATVQVRFRAAQNGKEQKSVCVATVQVCLCIGLTRTIYVRGLYVIFGRQIPK